MSLANQLVYQVEAHTLIPARTRETDGQCHAQVQSQMRTEYTEDDLIQGDIWREFHKLDEASGGRGALDKVLPRALGLFSVRFTHRGF